MIVKYTRPCGAVPRLACDRKPKPLTYHNELEGTFTVFLRWFLHLPLAISAVPSHSSIKSFRDHRVCTLHAISTEQQYRESALLAWKKKLTRHCPSQMYPVQRRGDGRLPEWCFIFLLLIWFQFFYYSPWDYSESLMENSIWLNIYCLL